MNHILSKQSLLDSVTNYRTDPQFCVPDPVRKTFENQRNHPKFILLGISAFASNFIDMVIGVGEVLAVVDDFKCHRGEQISGIDIISTDKFLGLMNRNPGIIPVNACRFDFSRRFFSTLCQLNGLPCLNFEQAVRMMGDLPRLDHRLADWAPVISGRLAEFEKLAERFDDDYSRETLWQVLDFHVTTNPEMHLQISKPYSTLYFRSGLFLAQRGEKFVDCGASIGESTTALIDSTGCDFSHSWMIEPDKINIKTLEKMQRKYKNTVLESKLTIIQCAVGSETGEVAFHHEGGHGGCIMVRSDPSAEKVPLRALDDIIDDRPSFIKMDIEGAEMGALRGARRLIKDSKPKLAISAYHRDSDLLDICDFVTSIHPDYKVGLRHHTEDRWDTCLYFY